MRQRGRRHRRRHRTPHGKGLGRMVKEAQRNELTEAEIYEKIADLMKESGHRSTLKSISRREKNRADFWKEQTKEDLKPNKFKVFMHTLISKIFGVDFGLKFFEKEDEVTRKKYREISKDIPGAEKVEAEEAEDETRIHKLINEERLKYISSMVLGVSDALVELTGALAGLTFAFQNTKLIALSGLITGIAASLSMGGSEYLSTKSGENKKEPLKAAFYTGIMYLITVILLILPYLMINQVYLSLGVTLAVAIIIILCFTFYVSVAQGVSFKKRFLEMASISLGVSALSFIVGILVRNYFGIDI
jgi:VIT1/CCC1 family predicted Fe2+/Mn2+ transporter